MWQLGWRNWVITLGVLTCLLSAPGHALQYNKSGVLEITHPTSSNAYFKQRDGYFLEVLKLALDKTGQEYVLKPLILPPMSETRSNKYLHAGRYDIHWLMTNNRHEEGLLPIRIPLFKGLIGWRLLLVHKKSLQEFANISQLGDLKTKKVVHGLDWPDTSVLVSNGFNLRTSLDWLSLYRLLDSRQADFFPRSVTEIWNENDTNISPNVVVEKTLVLRYPAAYYFFVSKANTTLAALVEQGLNAAVADGSFDALFYRTFSSHLERAHLDSRKMIDLSNPLLPPHTPLHRKELWYSLDK